MNRGSLPFLGAALCLVLVVPAATATQAAAPRVTSTKRIPLVAAQGDRISVTANVRGTGKRALIGLVLGDPAGSAKGGLALGKGVKVSHRGKKRVVVRGVVPKTVTPGELHTLLVCVNPAAALLGRGVCRKAARIATSGTSTEERIAGAQQTGRLSKAKGIVYGLYALRHDKRLPRELQGDQTGPGGDGAAIKAAASSFGTLPRSAKEQVFPFFVPPQAGGSAWQTQGRNWRKKQRRSLRPAVTSSADCRGYDTVGKGVGTDEERWPWQGVPTSDGKAIVWYGTTKNPKFKKLEGKERAAAYLYASALPKIWSKLSKEFGPPQSDAKEPCYHGPDGRLDVYIGASIVAVGSRFELGALAVTVPYPADGNYPVRGKFCTDRPAWIGIQPGLPKWALAHEFMHAIQFAHRYTTCDEPLSWWDEGGATWAGDFVYPDDNYEQREFPKLVTEPLGQDLSKTDYTAWPFWMMLERTQGIGVLRSIFANLRTKGSIQAVDASISGGYAKQIPRFFLHAWNQSPIGDPEFEISKSFKAWDKWNATPTAPASVTINLGALPERTLNLPLQSKLFRPLSVGAYHRVAIPENAVKELRFTNDLMGKPGGHVDALLHLANGSWKLADWTTRKTVTLCRDRPSENVRDLVIVSTNTKPTPLGTFTHQLRVRPNCARPPSYSGTISGTVDYGTTLGTGNIVDAHWSGNVKLSALFPTPDNAFPWFYGPAGDAGSVNYTVGGRLADCDIAGSTTIDLNGFEFTGINALTINAGDPLTYGFVLGMPQLFSFDVTASNCVDPNDNGPLQWFPAAGLPCIIDAGPSTPVLMDGTLSGAHSGKCLGTGLLDQTWQWNLAPAPPA